MVLTSSLIRWFSGDVFLVLYRTLEAAVGLEKLRCLGDFWSFMLYVSVFYFLCLFAMI